MISSSRLGSGSPADGAPGNRSLGQLVRTLSAETSQLLRAELALVRLELSRSFRRAGKEAAVMGAGAAMALVAVLALVQGVVLLVGDLLANYWLSALIVGLVLLIGAGALAYAGARQLRRAQLAPRTSLNSVRDSTRWAQREAEQVKSTLMGSGGDGPAPPAPGRQRFAPIRQARATNELHDPVRRAPSGGAVKRDARVHDEPPSGLIPFLKHVGREISEDDVMGQAAKLAYYAFLALPPALMAIFAFAGLFKSIEFAEWLQAQAALALPAAVNDVIIKPFINDVVLNTAPGPFSIGILLALWGASTVFAGLMDTLNVAYDLEESRPFLKKRATALLAMIIGTALFLLAAVSLLFGPEIADALRLGSAGALAWSVVRWPLTFGFVVAAFWIGYYLLPNRDQRRYKKVLLKAAAASAALWVAATALFRVYIANFSSYSETYGFLGAFIILLLWLYVTALVVLMGGELASEMEKRAT